MNDKNKNNGFAELVISGSENGGGGFAVPARGNSSARGGSRYAGRGAYPPKGGQGRADEQLCFSYTPELAFISSVSVFSWGAKRSFYERFRADALRYRDMHGKACQAIPFFSYIPQYSQMNLYQSEFYLYFRDSARRGEYIPADLSYILLYIYELINLSDESDPAADIEILCGLWLAYRDTYPALDKYMAEWVCDFCLLYKLGVPRQTGRILSKLCECATLREFYMSGAVENGRVMQGEVLEAFADYDRRNSRVELPEKYFPLFPRALETVAAAFPKEYFISDSSAVITRDAFCGSLCAHNVKRKLTVEYYPAFRRSGVRHMLGAAVKYTENKIRRAAGIKSRLHTDGLSDQAKQCIDRYFEEAMPELFARKSTRTESTAEYERYYDAPTIPFSPDIAQRIERESRAAAELLSGFDGEDMAVAKSETEVAAVPDGMLDDVSDSAALSDGAPDGAAASQDVGGISLPEAVKYMLEGGELDRWCRERGLMTDSVAAQINETVTDIIGDVLLINEGDGWQVISDYLEEAAEFAVGGDTE